MDEKLELALKETEFLDGMIIEGNNRKVTQFLSLREHLMKSIERCEELEQDANRWRALMSSQRIRILGSAGLGSPKHQHMGLEIWSTFPDAPKDETECGQMALKEYVDTVIDAKEA